MKKLITIALSLITLVIAAACTKTTDSDNNEEYKRTILFVMEETVHINMKNYPALFHSNTNHRFA